jgi:hypothetical protein
MMSHGITGLERVKKQPRNSDRLKIQLRNCCEKLPILLEFLGDIKILVSDIL